MMSTLGSLRAAFVAVVLASGAAAGQVKPVEPYWAVVSGDNASILCGDRDIMYAVGKVKPGQLLRVDGESREGWARVAYPAGTGVFVPADAVQVDPASRTASLTKASQLKAPNVAAGLSGSWKPVFDQALAAGTKLTLLETGVVDDGRGKAYRVAAPESARAYIRSGLLRRATAAETAQLAGAAPTAAKPDGGGVTPTPVDPPKPDAGVETTLTEPMVKPEDGGAGVQPAAGVGDAAAAPKTKVEDRQVATIKQLEAAFEAVRKQAELEAELPELMSEYQRTIDSLGDNAADAGLKARLTHRLDILKLKTDIQEEKRRAAADQAALSDEGARLAERLAAVEKSRQYTIVGRLSASMIYDGTRMPLMYRVMAVGGQAGSRTLAYVKPDEKLAIGSRLGQIVGVVGDATMDRSLNLNVIKPIRIDVLEPSAEGAAAAADDGKGG